MTNKIYAKAYKEVIEIIKNFPNEEYNKIPQEKIKFYLENMDTDYEFKINPEIDLTKQNISKEASAIIVTLYRDYFATEEQKKKLKELLYLNKKKIENEKLEKYSLDELFKKNLKNIQEKNIKTNDKTALVDYKNNIFTKFKNFIIKIFYL